MYTYTYGAVYTRLQGVDANLADLCEGVIVVMEVRTVVEVRIGVGRQLRATRLAALGTCNRHVTRQLRRVTVHATGKAVLRVT